MRDGVKGVEGWVLCLPAQPAAEGPVSAVHGVHVWSWLGGERGVGEAEPEGGVEVAGQHAAL